MRLIGSALLVSAALVACDKGTKTEPGGKPPAAQKDGADGLEAFFAESRAACTAKDIGRGKQLVMSAIPTRDQLKKILKPEVAPQQVNRLVDQYKELPPSDQKAACVFAPANRTAIKIASATVEDLIAYKPGTPAFDSFPPGAKKLAEIALAPGTTFYEVEATEPGNDHGTKFHMFFWDGTQWRMLGPAWRVFRVE